jgi:CBS domain-containing protein
MVVNGSGTPVGVLTDRDITVKVVAPGADPDSVRVGTLVARKPTVIRENAGILDATKLLSRRGIRRLPVVNTTGKLVGLIALDDLLILFGSELGHIASTLENELGRTRI